MFFGFVLLFVFRVFFFFFLQEGFQDWDESDLKLLAFFFKYFFYPLIILILRLSIYFSRFYFADFFETTVGRLNALLSPGIYLTYE